MRWSPQRAALLWLLGLAACGAPQAGTAGSATPAPLLIASRGIVMPLREARANIAFTPYIPAGELLATAVIPPLGGLDNRRTHGVAMEYENGGARLLLSQWPRNGIKIDGLAGDAVHHPCAPVAFKADGLFWTTRNGLVMTLQPDGAAYASRLEGESRRLLAAGHCPEFRKRVFRPSRLLTRAAFWHRQSAS